MTKDRNIKNDHRTQLRFAVISSLLASPPPTGELQQELERLAARKWVDRSTGETVTFSASTIERWYYRARALEDSGQLSLSLARQPRSDAGRPRAMLPELRAMLIDQHKSWPHWTIKLHYDNLKAAVGRDPFLTPVMPSYATVRREMKRLGLRRHRRAGPATAVIRTKESRETLSCEVTHVGALFHADFHDAAHLRIADCDGVWCKPTLLAVMDDHSRLICHLQWFFNKTAEVWVHGFKQALMKRGLPRVLMTDNGAAETAAEVTEGLKDLCILHSTTLPYSPEQNGKIERFWSQVENRMLAMIPENEARTMTLDQLNDLTQVWVQTDYNRRHHSEIKSSPEKRFIEGKDVLRPCPSARELKRAFRMQATRTVRASDATISIDKVRYQLPADCSHLRNKVKLRFARWDKSEVDLRLDDGRIVTLKPVDKAANAQGRRLPLAPAPKAKPDAGPETFPPFLRKLIDDHERQGRPTQWIPMPKDTRKTKDTRKK